ncbi:MAG: glutamine synthetase, partial [Chloroflexi bacterium]|nr:glutamine synthetase [Chloroflexota bacterium]MCI0900877.1 glutamine synthetase [Chloroflexota bacterium]
GEAITLAEGSELLRESLGEHIVHSIIQNKTMEWDEYRATVTDYEISRYLPIL